MRLIRRRQRYASDALRRGASPSAYLPLPA